MDSPSTPPVALPPPAPPASVNMATPELPKQPEKLLSAAPARTEHAGGHNSSWGAFIGIVIIIIVLVVGALYFWGAQLEKQEGLQNAGEEGQNFF